MTRRQLLAVGSGALLSGCGFHPVYMPTATGNAGVAERELAAIEVDRIQDRPGQELQQALQRRLEGSGDSVPRRYELSVSFGIGGEGIAVMPNSIATRLRTTGTANWTLIAQDPGRTRLTSGSAKVLDGYNLFDAQYFTADLENEAITRRMTEALADQITIQLATYFRKRGTPNG